MKRELFFRTAAARWVAFKPIPGQLVLSGGKLSFLCADPDQNDDWSVRISHLDRAEYFKKLSYHKHALLLFKKDGDIEHFSVKDRKEWREKIMKHIQTIH